MTYVLLFDMHIEQIQCSLRQKPSQKKKNKLKQLMIHEPIS